MNIFKVIRKFQTGSWATTCNAYLFIVIHDIVPASIIQVALANGVIFDY